MYALAFCLGLAVCEDPQQGIYTTEADCRQAIESIREDFGEITVVRDCTPVQIEG